MFFSNCKYCKVIFLSLVVIFMLTLSLWQISRSRSFQFFGGIVNEINTDQKVVALTFDDGPTEENTGAVLDILKRLGVRATFFVVGGDLEKNLELGKEIVKNGHEMGNHSFSHKRMVLKSPFFIKNEIDMTDALIRQSGYKDEIQFRPPYGKKLFYLPYYLKKHDRKTILWDLEPETYPEIAASSKNITNYVVNNVKPGSIILLHVMYGSRKESVKAIEGVVTELKKKGYKFVTVSELIKYQ